MNNAQRKQQLQSWEIVCLVILTPLIYLFGCFVMLNTEFDYPHRHLWYYVPEGLSYLIILGFDVAWVVGMRLLPLKNKRPKIILTWFVLLMSAVALSDLFLINMFHNMW
jgi:hypothetical protein